MTETKSYVLLQQGEKVEIMSLRDYFAAKAMQSFLMEVKDTGENFRGSFALAMAANDSYRAADQMLIAREKEQP